ncbi:MAG: hypothetical protein ACRDNP_03705 [Gaiellaceae bacterium]
MATNHWQELARRAGNGVEVVLLWNKSVDLVKVVVSDGRLCHHVDLEIAGADALRAFSEPFADATARLSTSDLTDEFWGFGPSSR